MPTVFCIIFIRTLPDVEGHIKMMHPMALATSNRFLGHTDAMLGHADILLDEEMEEEEEQGLFVLNFLSKKICLNPLQ